MLSGMFPRDDDGGAVGDAHALRTDNPHETTAAQVGAIPTSQKGAANGVAELDAGGKVPSAQLPIDGTINDGGLLVTLGTANSTTSQASFTATMPALTNLRKKIDLRGVTRLRMQIFTNSTHDATTARIGPVFTADDAALITGPYTWANGDAAFTTSATPASTAPASGESTYTVLLNAASTDFALEFDVPEALRRKCYVTLGAYGGNGSQTLAFNGCLIFCVTREAILPTPAANSVANSKLATVASSTIKGRATAGTGDVEDLTASQVRTILNVEDGATADGTDGDTHAAITDGSNPHNTPGLVTISVTGQDTITFPVDGELTLVAGDNVTLTTDATEKSVTIAAADPLGGGAANSVAVIEVAGQSAIILSGEDTLTVEAGANVTLTTDAGTRTLTIAASASGASNDFSRVTVGATDIDAETSGDVLTLVAGPNITLTPDAINKTVTITAEDQASITPAFGVIAASGQSSVIAESSADTLTLVNGGGVNVTLNATGDSVTFSSDVRAGLSSQEWRADDPTLPNGGIKPSNTATQNADAMIELFQRIHTNSTDRIKVVFPPGTYAINRSISPSGQDQNWDDGARMLIEAQGTVFTFSGGRTNYNQIKALDGGVWYELDHFTPNTAFPFKKGDSAVAGGALPLITAAGFHRKHAVLFDLTKCMSSDVGIAIRGLLVINGPETGTYSTGLVGMSAGRLDYGFAKNMTADAIKITGCSVGMWGHRFAQSFSTTGDLGDSFTSANFGWLDIRSCGRAIVMLGNNADAWNIGKATFACKDTSYVYRTHINIGAAFFNSNAGNEVSLSSPNPKVMDLVGGTLHVGNLYLRGGASPGSNRAWSVINVGEAGALSISCLHNDTAHGSQSGTVITMAKDDAGHSSKSGSVWIGGTSKDVAIAPLDAVVGVVATSGGGVRRRVDITQVNIESSGIKAGATPGVKVIPDYGSTSVGSASTDDYLESFGHFDGYKRQKITSGALASF